MLNFSKDITSEKYIAKLQNFADTLLLEGKRFGATVLLGFAQLDFEKVVKIHSIMNKNLE